jgi:hypothetical protein
VSEFNDWGNLPNEVQQDLDNGFVMTDIDDNYQRCRKISDTVFLYRAGTNSNNDLEEEEINVELFSESEKESFISGYYDNLKSLSESCENCQASINMLVAECYFETEIC